MAWYDADGNVLTDVSAWGHPKMGAPQHLTPRGVALFNALQAALLERECSLSGDQEYVCFTPYGTDNAVSIDGKFRLDVIASRLDAALGVAGNPQ